MERFAYLAEAATAQLAGVRNIVLAGARSPVSFFAYPGKPSDLVPDGCQVVSMAGPVGAAEALVALADRLAPNAIAAAAELSRPEMPSGALNVLNAADVIGVLLPEHAIVVDESNTSGLMLPQATSGAPAHDWLTLTGGSIGYGLPVSVRGGHRMSRPPGAVPGVGRFGDVHDFGALDAGSRAVERHHHRLRQPQL